MVFDGYVSRMVTDFILYAILCLICFRSYVFVFFMMQNAHETCPTSYTTLFIRWSDVRCQISERGHHDFRRFRPGRSAALLQLLRFSGQSPDFVSANPGGLSVFCHCYVLACVFCGVTFLASFCGHPAHNTGSHTSKRGSTRRTLAGNPTTKQITTTTPHPLCVAVLAGLTMSGDLQLKMLDPKTVTVS